MANNEWTTRKFAEIGEIITGTTPSTKERSFWGGDIPFVTPADMKGECYVRKTERTVTTEGALVGRMLPKDSVLVTCIGSVGKMAMAATPCLTNQQINAIVCYQGHNPKWVYYALLFAMERLKYIAAVNVLPIINKSDFGRQEIDVPPTEEQATIARVLDTVDKAIELTSKAVELARVLDHSLLNRLLEYGLSASSGQKPKRPAHWQIRRVDEVAEVGSGVTLGRDVSGSKYVELPYLRVANVQDGHLDLSVIKTVKVRIEEVDRYRLETGDVLMTEGGDLDKLGRGTLWEGQIPDCLHQNHIFRIRANRAVLDPRFFAYVVESDITKGYFLRVAKRTTNLASTNKTQVRAFRFPVPPLREQERIVEIISAAKAQHRGLMRKEEALRQLKRALMRDLLTGKVRVNNLNLAATAIS